MIKKFADKYSAIYAEQVEKKFDCSREAFERLVAAHVFQDTEEAFKIFEAETKSKRDQYAEAFYHGYRSAFIEGNCSPTSDLMVVRLFDILNAPWLTQLSLIPKDPSIPYEPWR